ncbi:hypothetical protein V6Z11_A04G079700 [Gossypium hirsutum]
MDRLFCRSLSTVVFAKPDFASPSISSAITPKSTPSWSL